jgi:hypothetical protein
MSISGGGIGRGISISSFSFKFEELVFGELTMLYRSMLCFVGLYFVSQRELKPDCIDGLNIHSPFPIILGDSSHCMGYVPPKL